MGEDYPRLEESPTAEAELAEWRRSHDPQMFTFNGERYSYFWHPYNTTWKNERAVELPIALAALANANAKGLPVLEAGNVLGHYGISGHQVIDKYEKGACVINDDIVDFRSPEAGFGLVISVSTIEHVGWDEKPRQPRKVWLALEKLKSACLAVGGSLVATVPLGYNAEMDRALREDGPLFQEQFYLKRISADNLWVQCEWRDVCDARYGEPYRWANALLVGFHTRQLE